MERSAVSDQRSANKLNYKTLADSPAWAGLSTDSLNLKTRVFGWTLIDLTTKMPPGDSFAVIMLFLKKMLDDCLSYCKMKDNGLRFS
jgi:hypothetical protein